MTAKIQERKDYSITGPESARARSKGLAEAQWYESPIPRKRMKELMKRKDGPAIRDTIIWLVLLVSSGVVAYFSWGTWWAIPAFLVYGTLYSSPGDSRWHECGHGTAFKTPWLNEVIYQFASFLSLRPATPWRWSHARHHTDTHIVGLDPEIIAPRPPIYRIILMDYFRLHVGFRDLQRIFWHCFGVIDKEEKEYIPASQFRKTFWESRVYMLIFVAVVAACLITGSILPAMFIILPSFYGAVLVMVVGLTQHLGLHENVLDHRLNTRTFYTNRIIRFLYWNMNYHIEHHMFPMVPYHALAALHREIKADCPKPSASLWEATREVYTALKNQKTDPGYTIDRPLPETARPYKYGIEQDSETQNVQA